jgi:NADH-quinone oxidoreductase subunit J
MLEVSDILFYILAAVCLFSALALVLFQNPIYSAISLVLTMVGIAGLFVGLDAYFIAGVQLIVYAGAVVVLFVMVLMLFDLKHEMKTFSQGLFSNTLKLVSVAVLLGTVVGAAALMMNLHFAALPADPGKTMDLTKKLSEILFTQYVFAFEAIGVLLLIIAVGAVTLSRIAGGTHADHQ